MTMTIAIIIAAAAFAVWAAWAFHRHATKPDIDPELGPHYAGQVHEDKDGRYHAQCICGWDDHEYSIDAAMRSWAAHAGMPL